MIEAGDVYVYGRGRILARLEDHGTYYLVLKHPACTIGEYFYILSYLMDLGYNAK